MMRKLRFGMKLAVLFLMILGACKIIHIAKQRSTLKKNSAQRSISARLNASNPELWSDFTTHSKKTEDLKQDSKTDDPMLLNFNQVREGELVRKEVIVAASQQADIDIDVGDPLQQSVTSIETEAKPSPFKHTAHLEVLYKESSDVFDLLPEEYLPDYKSFCWWDDQGVFQCLPSVYLAGMPKCGTTDLFDKLTWHPQLVAMVQSATDLTPIKERHYWSRGRVGRPGNFLTIRRRPLPKVQFGDIVVKMGAKRVLEDKELRIVDGTPSLMWDLGGWDDRYPGFQEPPYSNADLIWAVSPTARIIAILRDPVERLFSEYLYFWKGEKMRRERRTPQTFHDDVRREIRKFEKCLEVKSLRHCCYATKLYSVRLRIALGVYICYIRDWMEVWGDQLLVLTMNEYHDNPTSVLTRVFSHIGVFVPDQDELREFIQHSKIDNTNSDVKKSFGDMLDETRTLLQNFYRPFNEDLANFLKDTKYKFYQ